MTNEVVEKSKPNIDRKSLSCCYSVKKSQNSTKFLSYYIAGEPRRQDLALQEAQAQVIEKDEQNRTTVKKTAFIEIYRKTLGSVGATCEQVGIDRKTYYNWMHEDQEFRNEIGNSWQQKLQDVEQLLNKKMLEGDASLIRYFLDRRHPAFKPKIKVEGPIAGEEPLENFFNECEWEESNGQSSETKTKDEQLPGDTGIIQDQKQEGPTGSVSVQQGATLLLEKKDPAQCDTESAPKGNQ